MGGRERVVELRQQQAEDEQQAIGALQLAYLPEIESEMMIITIVGIITRRPAV